MYTMRFYRELCRAIIRENFFPHKTPAVMFSGRLWINVIAAIKPYYILIFQQNKRDVFNRVSWTTPSETARAVTTPKAHILGVIRNVAPLHIIRTAPAIRKNNRIMDSKQLFISPQCHSSHKKNWKLQNLLADWNIPSLAIFHQKFSILRRIQTFSQYILNHWLQARCTRGKYGSQRP